MNDLAILFWVWRFETHLKGLAKAITKVSGNEVTPDMIKYALMDKDGDDK